MVKINIALANMRVPSTPDESLHIALQAIEEAALANAAILCFPECFVPGYRTVPPQSLPDHDWLNRAWTALDVKAAANSISVILGTERIVDDGLRITTRVTNADGTLAGFQDKVQLDPSEDSIYSPGTTRHVFECGPLKFGIVICHEGWRYPETVRWAARNGAHVVFHPHFEVVEDEQYFPSQYAEPNNTFHEKAALCRAAENTCYFATVNCALRGATTTSAVVNPDGFLLVHQRHGQEGLLVAEIDTDQATGLLAKRFKPALCKD